MTEPIHTISLGAGVQSSTMALMAAAGEITPMPIAAIFADTQAEPKSVYTWLDWLEKQLPFPVHRVTAGNLEHNALRVRVRKDGKGSWVPSGIPHYSINADGTDGHGPRQCTYDFKIIPLEKERRRLVGAETMKLWRRTHREALIAIAKHRKALATWKRNKKIGIETPIPDRPDWAWNECWVDALVIAWIGISTDESSRAKPSRTPWIRNRYPHLQRGTNRDGCDEWMKKHGFPKAPKSACKFCPYHDDDEWIRLREQEPDDFKAAVKFDYAYRAAKIKTVLQKGFEPFLHKSRVPLDMVKFQKSHGKQLTMFNNECEGMCGV